MSLLLTGAGLAVDGEPRYADIVLADNPLLYWRLGESPGAVAASDSAGSHPGIYGAGVTLGTAGAVVGDADTAVTLDGSSGRITSSFNPFAAGSARTFEGWAWRDDTSGYDGLLSGHVASHGPGLYLVAGGQDAVFSTDSSAWAGATWTAAWPGSAQWVHWALTYDEGAGITELFINGISKGTRSTLAPYDATPGNIQIGALRDDSFFAGRMDEFAVYATILSPSRIVAHYVVGA
jgi:hypothetical protein